MLHFGLLLGLVWGGLWAAFLQWHEWGIWLARRRTWLTVVIGVAVDLGIALILVPWECLWQVAAIMVLSGVPIVTRSLWNEASEEGRLRGFYAKQDPAGEQDDMGAGGH